MNQPDRIPTTRSDEELLESDADFLEEPQESEPTLDSSPLSGDTEDAVEGPIGFSEPATMDGNGSAAPPDEAPAAYEANRPLSPYDDEPSTLSALPAPRIEDSIQVWEPPSPTAWRKNALTHAGSMLVGAAVTLGAVYFTVGLSPNKVVMVKERPLIAQTPQMPTTTMPGSMPGMVPGAAGGNALDPNSPLALGGDGNLALPEGSATLPGASQNPMPNAPPGTGVPTPGEAPSGGGSGGGSAVRGGGLIPPPPDGLRLPPLVMEAPPTTRPAVGLPTLPPGFTLPNSSGRPSANALPPPVPTASTPKGGRPKGPTAPPVRVDAQNNRVIAATPPRSAESEEDVDQAINRLRRSADSNPKDAATQLQLEKLYRKKLIQADRVDEMEQYRSLADQSRDRARALLNNEGSRPAPKAAAPKAAPKVAAPAPKAEPRPEPKDAPKGDPPSGNDAPDASPAGDAPGSAE